MDILNLKQEYRFTCSCGNEMGVRPPKSMYLLRMNSGMVKCQKCANVCGISIDQKNERMFAINTPDISGLPAACFRKATPEEIRKLKRQKI